MKDVRSSGGLVPVEILLWKQGYERRRFVGTKHKELYSNLVYSLFVFVLGLPLFPLSEREGTLLHCRRKDESVRCSKVYAIHAVVCTEYKCVWVQQGYYIHEKGLELSFLQRFVGVTC